MVGEEYGDDILILGLDLQKEMENGKWKMETREEGDWERERDGQMRFMEENTPTQSRGCGLSETVGIATKKASSHHNFLLYTVSLVRGWFLYHYYYYFIFFTMFIFFLKKVLQTLHLNTETKMLKILEYDITFRLITRINGSRPT